MSRSRRVAAMTRTSTLIQRLAAERADLGPLDGAEQLGLQRDVEIPDLVDEQRAAARLLEEPPVGRDGAGESAPLVPEERRFDEVGRNGGAIEDDERAACAVAPFVERLGEQLFAGPRLALDDEGHVGSRESLAERIKAPHLGARADHPPERIRGRHRHESGSDARDAKNAVAETNRFPLPFHEDLDEAHAVHQRAVGRCRDRRGGARPRRRRVRDAVRETLGSFKPS